MFILVLLALSILALETLCREIFWINLKISSLYMHCTQLSFGIIYFYPRLVIFAINGKYQ